MSSPVLKELNITREADYTVNEFLTPEQRQNKIDNANNKYKEALNRRAYIESLQQRQQQLSAGKPITYTYITI